MCVCVCIRRTGSSHFVLSFLILCYHVLQTGRGDDDGDDEEVGGAGEIKKKKTTTTKKQKKQIEKIE